MVVVYISWNPDCHWVSQWSSCRRVYILHLTTSCRRQPSCPAAQSQPLPPPRGLLSVLLASPGTAQLGQKLSWDQASGKEAVQKRHKKLCEGLPSFTHAFKLWLFSLALAEPCWRCACAWPTSSPPDLTSDFSGLLQSLVTITRPALFSLLRHSEVDPFLWEHCPTTLPLVQFLLAYSCCFLRKWALKYCTHTAIAAGINKSVAFPKRRWTNVPLSRIILI